jgi:hypothetical protein
MKYLKRIFEESNYNELLDFCESNLVYLLDEGWSIDITRMTDFYKINILTNTENHLTGSSKNIWKDCKDILIPFFNRLESEYELLPWVGRSAITGELRKNITYISGRGLTKRDINELEDTFKVGAIEVRVKGRNN